MIQSYAIELNIPYGEGTKCHLHVSKALTIDVQSVHTTKHTGQHQSRITYCSKGTEYGRFQLLIVTLPLLQH